MFSKNNIFSKIKNKKQKSFYVESLIAGEGKKGIYVNKTSPEYPVSLFDNIINIVSDKVCNKTFEKDAFYKFSKNNNLYFTKDEKKKIGRYLSKYFKWNSNILYRYSKTYNKLNDAFNKTVPYVSRKILTMDKFLECGNLRLERLIESQTKTQMPLPTIRQEKEEIKVIHPMTSTPVMPEIKRENKKIELNENQTKALPKQEKIEVKSKKVKKELTNIEIVYKEYRRLNNVIKKLNLQLNDVNSIDKRYIQRKIVSCIKLAKSLEEIIYNYKMLDRNYRETITNSQNIRKENALKSITRYVKSKNNNINLTNIEEHFSKEQLDYFNTLGIDVREIIINNPKTKRRK